jgi:hypothetical protein
VEVKAVKNFRHSVEIFGKIIGPLITGNHYKMEFWIAKVFVKREIAKFTESDDINIQKIEKIVNTERFADDLKKIDPFLFTAINENMDIISTLEDGSRKLGRYFSRAEDLMKIRQGKIFAVSRVGNSLNVTQNLSEEEKVLLDSLSSHISDWRVFLLDSKRKIK